MLKAKLSKGPIRVAGAMSGTSLDGVDVAMIETDGVTFEATDRHAFRPYSAREQEILRDGLGNWTGPEVEAATEQTSEAENADRVVTRVSRVFNTTQEGGFTLEAENLPDTTTYDSIERTARFGAATCGSIETNGDRA